MRSQDERRLTIQREPLGHVYVQLLHYATQHCPTALLVVREGAGLNTNGVAALETLKPFLRAMTASAPWTSGDGMPGKAAIYTYEYTAATARVLQSLATRLYAWSNPHLPADLRLLRSSGSPWLVSYGSEAAGYLVQSSNEEYALSRALPGLHVRWDPFGSIAG